MIRLPTRTSIESTRQLHNVAPHLAYAEHPASSPRAANTESFSVCATMRKASVRRVRDPHPCEENAHAPMGSKSPAFKGRASLLTRELCNIRVYGSRFTADAAHRSGLRDVRCNADCPTVAKRLPAQSRPSPLVVMYRRKVRPAVNVFVVDHLPHVLIHFRCRLVLGMRIPVYDVQTIDSIDIPRDVSPFVRS